MSGTVAPDGGWGWMIVFASFMIHFIMDGITYSMGEVFLQPMMENLNKRRAPIATIFAILPAITLVGGPIATISTNAYGFRKATIAGACVATLGFFISYFFANLWVYYIAIGVIGGLGFSLIYLPALSLVNEYFDRRRSFATGIAVCGSGLGTLAFPAIMPYIINEPLWFDYDGALLLESGLIFTCIIFGTLMIPLPQQQEREDEAKNQTCLNANDEQQKKLLSKLNQPDTEIHPSADNTSSRSREIIVRNQMKKSFLSKVNEQIDLKLLKDAAFALFVGSNFLTSLGFNVPYNFVSDVAKDANVPEKQRHWILMSIGIANCFGRLFIGYLADRKWMNRLFLYNTTLIIAGLATMTAPFCNHSVYTHMIYAGFFGFFSGGYVSLTSNITEDLVGANKLNDALGTVFLFQGIAVAIGTPVCGAMRDRFENFERPYLWPYTIFGGTIALSGVILFAIPFLRREKKRHQQSTEYELEMKVLPYAKQNLSTSEQQQQL